MYYKDKNGIEIKAGDKLLHNDGEIQEVFQLEDDDLGFNASNYDFLKAHPTAVQQFYPLFQFDLKEWCIVNGR